MTKKEEDYIKEFAQDREIISPFLIKQKEMKKTKTNTSYLEVTLQDKTGQIKGRMFKHRPFKTYEKIEKNTVWNIVGKIQEFPTESGRFNILIESMNPTTNYNEEDFIRKVEDYEKHVEFLFNTIETIENIHLKKLLKEFFNDEEFKNNFLTAPAAKIHHHNYKGGLLVHTNEVIKICQTITYIYNKINYDLLITGAILHDIGKIETYDYETENIEMKYEGIMLDHLFIGANMIENRIKKIDAPKKLKIQLIHMILSHHGDTSLGWGSAVSPKTPEALALHHADDMSAKITSSLENK